MEKMRLQGYRMNKTGYYGEPVKIDNMEDFNMFVTENVEKYYELRVTDVEDCCVFHVVEQTLLFPIPEQGSPNNKWDSVTKQFKTVVN